MLDTVNLSKMIENPNYLNNFYWYKYRISFKVLQALKLQFFQGITLYSILKIALSEVAPNTYGNFFDPQIPDSNFDLGKFKNSPPLPLIIEPNKNIQMAYYENDTLFFDLIIIGDLIDYTWAIQAALENIEKQEIGALKGKIKLSKKNIELLLKSTI